MPGIFVFSEDCAIARQLLTPGFELKQVMHQPSCVITTAIEAAEQFIAAGADKVFVLQTESLWPEGLATAIANLVVEEQASVVLVGGTVRGKNVAARVATRLQAGMSSDAHSVTFADGKIETARMLYAGLALSEEILSLPAVVTIPPRTFVEPAATVRQGIVKTVAVVPDERVAISEVCPNERTGVDIETARKLVTVGRGFRQKTDLLLAEGLAKALDADVACTRGVAEDFHWLPVERYIGISGRKVKPDLYLSAGVSGQVQHIVGMRDSKVIAAINTDERAPIFEAADYGIVGDLYEVLPLLTAALENKQ